MLPSTTRQPVSSESLTLKSDANVNTAVREVLEKEGPIDMYDLGWPFSILQLTQLGL
jgi:hypothetical protein